MEANSGKIEWAKAFIPPGRTIKAVRHMIDGERKKWAASSTSDGNKDGDDANAGPSTPKTPRSGRGGKARAKDAASAEETPSGSGRKRNRPSPVSEEQATTYDDAVKRIKAEPENADETLQQSPEIAA